MGNPGKKKFDKRGKKSRRGEEGGCYLFGIVPIVVNAAAAPVVPVVVKVWVLVGALVVPAVGALLILAASSAASCASVSSETSASSSSSLAPGKTAGASRVSTGLVEILLGVGAEAVPLLANHA